MPALHTSVASGENSDARDQDDSRVGRGPVSARTGDRHRSSNTFLTRGMLERLIGERLIDVYAEALREPVPFRFKALLRDLVSPK